MKGFCSANTITPYRIYVLAPLNIILAVQQNVTVKQNVTVEQNVIVSQNVAAHKYRALRAYQQS